MVGILATGPNGRTRREFRLSCFVHHKFHLGWPRIEPPSLRCQAGDWLFES